MNSIFNYPASTTTIQWSLPAPGHELWQRLGDIYSQPWQQASQELWTSSARIVQEHAVRAWMEASQSCVKALTDNAAAIQQRAFASAVEANQKALNVVLAAAQPN